MGPFNFAESLAFGRAEHFLLEAVGMQWPCIDDFRFLNQLSGCNGGYRSLVPARVAFDGDVVINDLRVPPPPQEVRCGSYRYEKWAFGRMVWNLDKEQNSQRQIVVLFPDWICEATGENRKKKTKSHSRIYKSRIFLSIMCLADSLAPSPPLLCF
jgi:hypothetical protein